MAASCRRLRFAVQALTGRPFMQAQRNTVYQLPTILAGAHAQSEPGETRKLASQ